MSVQCVCFGHLVTVALIHLDGTLVCCHGTLGLKNSPSALDLSPLQPPPPTPHPHKHPTTHTQNTP